MHKQTRAALLCATATARSRSARHPCPPTTFAGMTYSFLRKSADEIIKDLEANAPQGQIGAGAYESQRPLFKLP